MSIHLLEVIKNRIKSTKYVKKSHCSEFLPMWPKSEAIIVSCMPDMIVAATWNGCRNETWNCLFNRSDLNTSVRLCVCECV